MPPTDERLLCVSIHDVAPGTWRDCERLACAIREVADIPLTWLVVPRYHGRHLVSSAMEEGLGGMLARGDELALHGYTHLDTGPASTGMRSRFLRGVYTRREGEFAALAYGEARHRIGLGLNWFARRGWQVAGFVPPAWLMSPAAWEALSGFPFTYATSFSRFHLLPQRIAVFSPSLVYAARNRAGRWLSPLAADAFALLLARAPVVRLALHPPDVRHPRLLRHAQGMVERLLADRRAVTKARCASLLTSTAPSASSPDPSQGGKGDSCCNAASRRAWPD